MMFLDAQGRPIGHVTGGDDPMTAFVALRNVSRTLAELSEIVSDEARAIILADLAEVEMSIRRCAVTDPRWLGLFRPVARNRRN